MAVALFLQGGSAPPLPNLSLTDGLTFGLLYEIDSSTERSGVFNFQGRHNAEVELESRT